jgi:hypothetical protein
VATPEQVLAGHQAAVAAVRASVLAYVRLVWRAQGSYRTEDVDRLVSLIVPRVRAGQLQTANLTSAYIASIDTVRTGVLVKPVPVDEDEVLNGRGVPAAEVYRRPAVEVYTALAAGASYTDAVARGLTRLNSLAATDLQMSKVRQARVSYLADSRKYFRRVLNGGSNCGLCTIASTQRYSTKDLSPIHPGCDCGVDALADNESGKHVLDQTLLDATHAQIEGTFGESFRDGRSLDYRLIDIRQHGEIGDVLTWRGQHFDGPSVAA